MTQGEPGRSGYSTLRVAERDKGVLSVERRMYQFDTSSIKDSYARSTLPVRKSS
jgi:hypothetical protein